MRNSSETNSWDRNSIPFPMPSSLPGSVMPSEEREKGIDSSERERLEEKKGGGEGVEECLQANSQRRLLQTGRKDSREVWNEEREGEREEGLRHSVGDCLGEKFPSETPSERPEEEKTTRKRVKVWNGF